MTCVSEFLSQLCLCRCRRGSGLSRRFVGYMRMRSTCAQSATASALLSTSPIQRTWNTSPSGPGRGRCRAGGGASKQARNASHYHPARTHTHTHTHTGTHIQRRRACLRVQIQIGGSAFPQGWELGTARPVPRAPGIPDSFPRRRRCRRHDLAESDKPEIVLNVSARPCLWAPRCAAVQSMLTAHDVVASRSGGWRPD